MKLYPEPLADTLDAAIDSIKQICRIRRQDVGDFDNLVNIFMSGRKVNKIPTSSTDTASTDRSGDFNYNASYLFILINNSGTLEWRRVTLSSF